MFIGHIPTSAIAGSHDNSMLNMLRRCPTVFLGRNKERSTPDECPRGRNDGQCLMFLALQEFLNGLDRNRRTHSAGGMKTMPRPTSLLPTHTTQFCPALLSLRAFSFPVLAVRKTEIVAAELCRFPWERLRVQLCCTQPSWPSPELPACSRHRTWGPRECSLGCHRFS